MLGTRTPAAVQDGALLITRAVLGVVLVAHGWQKVDEFGLAGTAAGFAQMGVPAPDAAALFAAAAELGGGILLLLGLLTPVAAALVVANMAGAFWFAHRGLEPFVGEGGWELVGVLGAGALLVGAVGPGRLSLDHLAFRNRRPARSEASEASVAA